MPQLKHLNVAWNQLSNVSDELSALHKHAGNLMTLDLRHNPWQKVFIVRFFFTKALFNYNYKYLVYYCAYCYAFT